MSTYLQDFMQAAAKHPIDPTFINQNAKQLMAKKFSIKRLNHELAQQFHFSFENVLQNWTAGEMIDIYGLILSAIHSLTLTRRFTHQFTLSQFDNDSTTDEKLKRLIENGVTVKELRANTIFVRNVFLDLNYCKDLEHFKYNLKLNQSVHQSLLDGGEPEW